VIYELGDVTVAASDEMEKFHNEQGSPPPRQEVIASMIIEDAFHTGFGALTVESVSQVRHQRRENNAYRHLGNSVSHPRRQSLQRLHAGRL
jgi:hypothetical protein